MYSFLNHRSSSNNLFRSKFKIKKLQVQKKHLLKETNKVCWLKKRKGKWKYNSRKIQLNFSSMNRLSMKKYFLTCSIFKTKSTRISVMRKSKVISILSILTSNSKKHISKFWKDFTLFLNQSINTTTKLMNL